MSVWKKQIGGKHYIKYKIQPSQFVTENKLLYPEGSVIKYILRHQDKGGKEDLLKAKHFIDMIIERDYGDHIKSLPHGFTLTKSKEPDMTPMTEEEEYRNAGITKEEAEKK